MFKKKNASGISVMHYEGLAFPTDFPCVLDLTNTALIIKRLKPETTITLPITQIQSFSAMDEPNFMLKYHGQGIRTSKMKSIQKYYLVVHYVSKDGVPSYLAFWGTASDYSTFMNWAYQFQVVQSSAYSL